MATETLINIKNKTSNNTFENSINSAGYISEGRENILSSTKPKTAIPAQTVAGNAFETGLIDSNPGISNKVIAIDPSYPGKISKKFDSILNAKSTLNNIKEKTTDANIIATNNTNIPASDTVAWSPNGFNPELVAANSDNRLLKLKQIKSNIRSAPSQNKSVGALKLTQMF